MIDPRTHAAKTEAFSLAELLVAMGITVLLVALLGRVLIAATSVWQLSDQRIDAFRDARAALQLMTVDLSRADVNGNAQMLTLAKYSTDSSYAVEAYAVSPMKNTGKSDLCAVGYYLDWDATAKAYSLRRFVKDSNTTAVSLAISSPDFGTLYDRTKGTTPETLASYVWDLRISPGEGSSAISLGGDPATKWNWVEVRFKAMSVKAGRKLQASAAVSQATWADSTLPAYKTFILKLR